MPRTRIKFCGITREEDRDAAVALGVDALGFILVPGSPRQVTVARAAALRSGVPPFVSTVLLVRNAPRDEVAAALAAVRPDLVQFHGEEDPVYCASFGHPYLKAVAMRGEQDSLATLAERYAGARALLLDGHAPGALGGTGQAFDWARAVGECRLPVIVAGGLHPANVAAAITAARPFAVDVSSGIEAAPGVKDSGKMRTFVEAAQRADAEFLP